MSIWRGEQSFRWSERPTIGLGRWGLTQAGGCHRKSTHLPCGRLAVRQGCGEEKATAKARGQEEKGGRTGEGQGQPCIAVCC